MLNRFHGAHSFLHEDGRDMSVSGLSQVTDGLFLSNAAAASRPTLLTSHHITCVINLSLERRTPVTSDMEYLHFPVADQPETALSDLFDTISHKIYELEASGGRTLIHCAAGISRAPTLALAYLMKHRGVTLLQAHAHLRSRRPIIRPNIGFWRQLVAYELDLFGKNTVRIIESPVGPIPDIYEAETKNMVPF